MCMCVYVFVCNFCGWRECVYVFKFVYVYLSVYVYVCMCVYVCVCMYVCVCVCACVRAFEVTYNKTWAYIYAVAEYYLLLQFA